MIPVKQRTVHQGYGDCFAACLASLLELPIEAVPSDTSSSHWNTVTGFLEQFGLDITCHNSGGPIWSDSPWIAFVKSQNYEGVTHAIIMKGSCVLFDPSTKTRHKKGKVMSSTTVIGGYIIRVADFSLLHKLDEYRKRLDSKPEIRQPKEES